MMRKKLHRRLKKAKKEVRDLVPETAVEKVAQLNPLGEPAEPQVLEDAPRITNETIAEHRENVLSGARKYIYPLRHSKHRIIVITSSIIAVTLVAFLIYCTLALYRLYQYNAFLYRVTQVMPFPVAKTGGSFVSYENYLFELRHRVHYQQSQQLDKPTGGDEQQLIRQYRKDALSEVVNDAYVKILAQQNGVKVSGHEVDERLSEVREQNRLGGNNKVFAAVLRDYFGWSVNDYKRSLKQQILAEKVVAKLDVATRQRAGQALAQARAGADFAALAKQTSDDPAKANGGEYGFGITKANPNVAPQVVQTMFNLKAGQISDIINAGPTLEIVKVLTNDGTTVTAKHISFNLKPISTYIKPLATKQPAHAYVRF